MTAAIATQATSFALSALVTLATLAGVEALAAHQVATAGAVVLAQQARLPRMALQTVVVEANRRASA